MVTPAGIEPATPVLEGRCSIQLSYGVLDRNSTIFNTLEFSQADRGL
jgi:hypothetical protein